MIDVSLVGVTKQFGAGPPALANVTLPVAAGELLVLLGPSGGGKTTLLRILAGLEAPTAGRVSIGGRDVTSWPAWRRNVALVFQRPALYPHRSVRDNLLAGVRLATPWWRRTPAVPLDEMAQSLGLADLLDRRPHQLSGGQQQRVALGRALLRNPAVLLLDEPLSALEISLRLELRRELHLLQRRRRVTMIYVTHDPQEALALGDRLAILERGRLVQTGAPAEVRLRPATLFAAGLGEGQPPTIVTGVIRRGPDGVVFRAGSLDFAAPPGLPDGPLQALLPLRAVRLADEGVGGEAALVEAAPDGGWRVTVRAGGLLWAAATPSPPQAGQQVLVGIDWHLARWFDAGGHSLATV